MQKYERCLEPVVKFDDGISSIILKFWDYVSILRFDDQIKLLDITKIRIKTSSVSKYKLSMVSSDILIVENKVLQLL